jgi:hypothetical protein
MKKLLTAVVALPLLGILIGADIERSATSTPPPTNVVAEKESKPCYGYTIIEFGKGINCNGDTVKLVKVNGGQQLATTE